MQTMIDYTDTTARFLREYANARTIELNALTGEGFTPIPDEQLQASGMAWQLGYIARAAQGELPREDEEFHEEHILDGVDDVLRCLFWPPGIGNNYQIPETFWSHPLGGMLARAILWAREGDLITLQQAADLRGVTAQAISNAVRDGRLNAYINPDAPARQGRTLVSRQEIEEQ